MQNTKGFTLLEISIVLVIISLIAGGILVGATLIRAAELKKMMEKAEEFRSAIDQFQVKYNAMPGDMKNATQFWGAVAGSATAIGVDATCKAYFDATHTPRIATCNGDGDGRIDAPTVTDWFEVWLVWQHLANGGLIEGMYTGQGLGAVTNNLNSDPFFRVNEPGAPIKNVSYAITYENAAIAGDAAKFIGEYGNTMRIGSETEVDSDFLPPADARSVDLKFDDGKPGTGNLRTYHRTRRPDCATSDVTDTADYQNVDRSGCNFFYIMK